MLNLADDAVRPRSARTSWRELAIVIAAAAVLSVVFTWPLTLKLGQVGRVDVADGQWAIWNVAWVARALVLDPLHVFDTNIFYPHRWTLIYSESNLGAGALGIPAYWLTRNPYAAHNSAVLISFALSQIGMYFLVRHLTGSRASAAASAICYAFCPYVLAWTAEVQLMMIFGLPFIMLALHRMMDEPTPARGAVLGLTMAVQTLFCGYYGVFGTLMVAYMIAVLGTSRRMWREARLWAALATGAIVAVAAALPLLVPYISLHRVTGFSRPLEFALSYSANWSAFVASGAYAHRWLLTILPPFSGVLFPGFVATLFGVVGAVVAARTGRGEVTVGYGGLVLLACWASFGPAAGLYTVLYRALPVFAWMRAPSRFGLIVVFGLGVLAGIGVSSLARRTQRGWGGVTVAILAFADVLTPLHWPAAAPPAPVYEILRAQPRGVVIEMPFYRREAGLFRHTRYMLASTAHWFPLVNGYSDYMPPDYFDNAKLFASFPSLRAFNVFESLDVRYVVFHMNGYNSHNRSDVLARLHDFEPYLRPISISDDARLYEIAGFPKQ